MSNLGRGIQWFGLSKTHAGLGLKRSRWRQIQRYFLPSRHSDLVTAEFAQLAQEKFETDSKSACHILNGALGLETKTTLDLE